MTPNQIRSAATSPLHALANRRIRSHQVQCLCASFEISAASNSAELRSIASLRAANFFDIATASCSEFAARSHIRLKADTIWQYLEEAYAERRSQEQAHLICLYAAALDAPTSNLAAAVRQTMDPSCTLPSEDGQHSRIVLGSLDLNIGPRLGGEHLAGNLPSGNAPKLGRAYISNVSVAAAARRQGVASALVAAAYQHAARLGVSHLYVHAAVDNEGAVQLYGDHCGFEVEQQESVSLARRLNRAQRILFHKTVMSEDSLDGQA